MGTASSALTCSACGLVIVTAAQDEAFYAILDVQVIELTYLLEGLVQ